ncbi:response regulator [Aurantivibrio infirmus]
MRRILVIDDEELLRENLAAYLEDDGYQVLTTGSAESGLVKLSAFNPDLVLVDLRLGGVDGERFVKTALGLKPGTKFIIHTGSQEYRVSEMLENLGISAGNVLYKPITDLGILADKISELLHSPGPSLRYSQ